MLLPKRIRSSAVGVTRTLFTGAGLNSRAAEQASQQLLRLRYAELAHNTPQLLPTFADTYLRAFSQNGEDGLLLYLFAVLGSRTRSTVEICAGNGIECNSANLIINHGWTGLLVDGNATLIEEGRRFYASCPDTVYWAPTMVQTWVTAENVNDCIADNGFAGEVDLLSIDLDGMDYWIWKAIEVVTPRVVLVEYQDIWGPDVALTVPYRPEFISRDSTYGYQGASLLAFVKLARERGYRLVGTERLGFNAFFVRNDLGQEFFPEIDHRTCFDHPKVRTGIKTRLPTVSSREWTEV